MIKKSTALQQTSTTRETSSIRSLYTKLNLYSDLEKLCLWDFKLPLIQMVNNDLELWGQTQITSCYKWHLLLEMERFES